MLLTELQLNRCLDFTVRRVVMSTKMFFQLGKDTQIRQRQLDDVREGMIPECEIRMWKVCSCYRTGVRSNVVLWEEMLPHIRAMSLLVLSVRSSAG